MRINSVILSDSEGSQVERQLRRLRSFAVFAAQDDGGCWQAVRLLKNAVIPSVARDLGGRGLEKRAFRRLPHTQVPRYARDDMGHGRFQQPARVHGGWLQAG